MCKLIFPKKIRGSSPKYSPKLFGQNFSAKQLYLCVIPTIWLVMESPKYSSLFFVKRENLRISIAQKTPKNKRPKLSEKRMCKLYFLEIIRGISSPKYSIKLSVNTFD